MFKFWQMSSKGYAQMRKRITYFLVIYFTVHRQVGTLKLVRALKQLTLILVEFEISKSIPKIFEYLLLTDPVRFVVRCTNNNNNISFNYAHCKNKMSKFYYRLIFSAKNCVPYCSPQRINFQNSFLVANLRNTINIQQKFQLNSMVLKLEISAGY